MPPRQNCNLHTPVRQFISKGGGFGSFSKLYSLVPYQTYISVSHDVRHFTQFFQSPSCPSLWWNAQRVYRLWFRWQLFRANEKRACLCSSSQIQFPQQSVLISLPVLPQRPQRAFSGLVLDAPFGMCFLSRRMKKSPARGPSVRWISLL